ncbi:MAG: hypothetical protein IJ242_05425 [Clostridia bacterium]|nr:hypothetical protein [Clostridia bacterium]
MKNFVPKEKMSKKARKALENEQRITWSFTPSTRKIESKKIYNRKRRTYDRSDVYGIGSSLLCFQSQPSISGC